MEVLWRFCYYYIDNVYFSCCLIKKRSTWKENSKLKRKYKDMEWCIEGNFSSIICYKERKDNLLVNRVSEM